MIFLCFCVFNENKIKELKLKVNKKPNSKFILVIKKKVKVA